MFLRQLLYPLFSIAVNTFREAVRSKVLGALLLFVVLSSIASSLLGQMSLHEEVRVTTDGTLFASTMFSMAIAVYAMVTLLHTEMERRTIYTILTKPIARWQFLVGKYFGVGLLLAVVVTVLFLFAAVLVTLQGGEVTIQLAYAYMTVFMQGLLVTALTLLFASFSSPLTSGLFTVSLFITGNLLSQLEAARSTLREVAAFMTTLVDVLLVVLPNFESLNLSWFVTHQEQIPVSYMLAAGWYTVSYVALLLIGAIFIFGRKDLA